MNEIKRGYWWGSLCLSAFPFAVMIDGDPGAPEVVLQETAQQLQDGEIVTSPRKSNRSMSWTVWVEGSDLRKLAEYEAQLVTEAERERNTWRIVAGDDVAPDTVFDTFAASVKPVQNKDAEQAGYRAFELTIPASPFGRSAQPVVVTVPAPPSGTPTIETIDDCSSVAHWVGSWSPPGTSSSLTVQGGTAVRLRVAFSASTGEMSLRRGGLVEDMTSTPWLRVEALALPVSNGSGIASPLGYLINGLPRTPDVVDGRIAWFDCTADEIVFEVELTTTVSSTWGPPAGDLEVYDLSRSDMPTDTGFTGRQSSRQIPVAGTQRTPGSLEIASASDAFLGDVLVYTRPAVAGLTTPDLQAKRTSGGSATGDSATVSGGYTALATLHEFTIPADQVSSGVHLLMARIKASASSRTLTWATRWKMGSTTSANVESGSVSVLLDSGFWRIVPVALVTIPPRDIGPSGSVLIRLIANAATSLDEAWLFDMERGHLSAMTYVPEVPAIGIVFSRLWLDAATLDRPAPSAWAGTQPDRSDQIFASQLQSFGAHEFKPPALSMFVVTTGADDAAATLIHFPRWHTWAAS